MPHPTPPARPNAGRRLAVERLEDRVTPAGLAAGSAGHGGGCGCPFCGYAPPAAGPGLDTEPVFATPFAGSNGRSAADFPNTPIGYAAGGLPVLDSRPGAPTDIYLDFDGGTGGAGGTTWTAYDVDGDPATYNAAEQATVVEAWRNISVYFSMFDANVTTVFRPATPKNWTALGNNISGGYSYGGFPATSARSFNQSSDARTRQSGIAHEIGHNYGLAHQSDWDLNAVKQEEYSSGDNALRVPLMGVDFAGRFPKFFFGRPAGAATSVQDDVAVIAGRVAAATPVAGDDGFAPDDFPGGAAPATLEEAFGIRHRTGVIERAADFDSYRYDHPGGRVALDLYAPYPSALDGVLEVRDAGGALVARADAPTGNEQSVALDLPAGAYTLTVTGAGNYGDLGVYHLAARPLPGGFAASDIGAVGRAGNASEAAGTFYVGGAGADIGGTADAFRYAYQRLTGDGEVVARVAAVGGTAATANAGVMMRESLASNSRHATMAVTRTGGAEFLARTATGGSTTASTAAGVAAPYWVRLVRAGNTFTGSRSADGVTWVQQSSATVAMGATVYVGLAVGAASTTVVNDSTFTDVSVTGAVSPGVAPPAVNALPAPAGLTATSAAGPTIALAWTGSAGAAGYAVERSADGVTWVGLATTDAATLTATDPSAAGGRRWFYRVAASDGVTLSGRSAAASAVTRPDVPAELSLSRTATGTTVMLNWTDVPGDTGYRVERSVNGGAYTTAATLPANAPVYTNTGLAAASQYAYRVVALSPHGESPAATAATARLAYGAVGAVLTQSFDTLPAGGTFAPQGGLTGKYPVDLSAAPYNAAGLADEAWWVGRRSGATRFAVDAGTSTAGGARSYGSAGSFDRALGLYSGTGSVPAAGVVLTNTTGQTLTSFTVTFTVEQWRRGDNSSGDTLAFDYQVGGADVNFGSFTAVAGLTAASPNRQTGAGNVGVSLDGNAAGNRATLTLTVAATWLAGQSLVLRWSDTDVAGADDGLAVDDFAFTASGAAVVITSDGGGDTAAVAVSETATAVTTVTSTVPTSGLARTFTVVGGADRGLFALDPATGALSFAAAPSAAAPLDKDGDNVYEVAVEVRAGAAADTQAISVRVLGGGVPAAARNDAYTVEQARTLAVPAAGVLANDAAAAGDRVTLLYEGFEGLPLRPYTSPTESGGDGTDWTDAAPGGWGRAVSTTTPTTGPAEFYGWRVHDVDSWVATEGDQGRSGFTRGGAGGRGQVFVADGDAYDDGVDIDGPDTDLNAFLTTPAVPLAGLEPGSVRLEFESSFNAAPPQTGLAQYSHDGGLTWVTLLTLRDTAATNEAYSLAVPTGTAVSVQFRFAYVDAQNDWWWAIDDVRVTAAPTAASAAAVVAPPANGSLDLRPDGGFAYTPFAGFAGADSFLYRPAAGANAARAAVTVTPRPTRFADDAWAGLAAGAAVADLDPVVAGAQPGAVGTAAFASPAAARAGAVAGGVIVVNAGAYAAPAAVPAGTTVAFQQGASSLPGLDAAAAAAVRLDGVTLTLAPAGTATVAAPVTGPGGLTVAGPGTQVLAGANDYTGPTLVTGGRLAVTGALQSAVTVGGGAALDGTGSVGRPVTVNGTLAPGAGAGAAGAFAVGDLVFGPDAVFELDLLGVEVGTGYDRLTVSGTADLAGAALALNTADFTAPAGQPFVVLANDGADPVAGTFDGLPNGAVLTAGSQRFEVRYAGGDGNDVTLTRLAAPAPAQTGVRVNGGAAPGPAVTASRLTSLVVTFDGPVTVDAGAFTLTSGAVTLVSGDAGLAAAVAGGVVTLTFAGTAGVEFGSLADGVWTLTTDAARVRNPDGAAGVGTVATPDVRRLFGDLNSDGVVDVLDAGPFDNALNTSAGDPGYLPAADANADGVIDGLDAGPFDGRLNTGL